MSNSRKLEPGFTPSSRQKNYEGINVPLTKIVTIIYPTIPKDGLSSRTVQSQSSFDTYPTYSRSVYPKCRV